MIHRLLIVMSELILSEPAFTGTRALTMGPVLDVFCQRQEQFSAACVCLPWLPAPKQELQLEGQAFVTPKQERQAWLHQYLHC